MSEGKNIVYLDYDEFLSLGEEKPIEEDKYDLIEKIKSISPEINIEIYEPAEQLVNSGFYDQQAYDQLVKLTKKTKLERKVTKLKKYVIDIKTVDLEEVLTDKENYFNSEIADIIVERINKETSAKQKLFKLFVEKFLYMVANDDISKVDMIYLAQLCLHNMDQ